MSQNEEVGDVAVVGMACKVAGANSPSELWELLATSRDVQSEITRFNIKAFYNPDGGSRKGMTNVKDAYMLSDDEIDRFDHSFFHTTPLEAIAIDPQQRMLLEVVYEALENAGVPLETLMGSDTAVYAGMDSCDYHGILTRDIEATPRYLATGTATCMAANRISYVFNLSGASMSVDTACSSSMAAFHEAVHTLKRGDSSMAIVCGAKLILTPDMFIPSSELGFLSPRGRCHSFDAGGDGYGRGEGVLALLLKPLKAAIQDNDPIRAVVKGVSLNQDGRTQGITLPSSKAQEQNMKKLYQSNHLDPGSIQYVEAHGTGTAAGDPLEFTAINSVFSGSHLEAPLVVGSVKSNIGHLEAAAALASIMKTIECMERGKIPPQMHFKTPNPKIDFRNVKIPTKVMDWPSTKNGIRRAGINTFGAGGTNGHAVLESFSQRKSSPTPASRRFLFKVSAAGEESLKKLCLKYADYVELARPNISDFAHTLLSRRSLLRHCYFFTAGSSFTEVAEKLREEQLRIVSIRSTSPNNITFVFTGQGAQWPQMGKVLFEQSRIFRNILLQCDEALSKLSDGPTWSLVEELLKSSVDSNVYHSEFSQPLCTALQLGLVELWRSWGLSPMNVVGHSSGEIAAAYAAQFISLRDAVIIAYYRGCIAKRDDTTSDVKPQGAMCAIGSNEDIALKLLSQFNGKVDLAAVNSPDSCTLSGDEDAVKEIVKMCAEDGIFCRQLKIDMAYHSHHMLSSANEYELALKNANITRLEAQPVCRMISSVTGHALTAAECLPSYWKDNMVSTVRFSAAVTKSLTSISDSIAIVELGPHPSLEAPTRETIQSLDIDIVDLFHSCHRGKNDMESMLQNAGSMMAVRIPLSSQSINAQEIGDDSLEYGQVLTDLPSYAWNHHTSIWSESRISRNIRFRKFPHHELLGSRYLEDIPSSPSWRNLLVLKEFPWLLEYKEVLGISVLPLSSFILMAIEAGRQLETHAKDETSGIDYIHLADIQYQNELPLSLFKNSETAIELHFNAHLTGENKYNFSISSTPIDESSPEIRHLSGILKGITGQPRRLSFVSNSVDSNPMAVKCSKPLIPYANSQLSDLRVGAEGSSGCFSVGSSSSAIVDSMILQAILDMPSESVLTQKLPMATKIASISSIIAPINFQLTARGCFLAQTNPSEPSGLESNLEISLGPATMSLSGLRLSNTGLVHGPPLPSSLFFASRVLPDITTILKAEPMDISQSLELVFHKWPMCDIGLSGSEIDVAKQIFHILRRNERKRFRSVQVISTPDVTPQEFEDFRINKNFDPEVPLHLLFTNDFDSLENVAEMLRPRGLLCTPSDNNSTLPESFSKVCTVTGLQNGHWVLYRKEDDKAVQFLHPRRPIIFGEHGPYKLSCLQSSSPEYVSLHADEVTTFCKQAQNQKEPFDAIIFDSTDKPVFSSWDGESLLPWLQILLEMSRKIIWVTRQDEENPFSQLAGTLLRTIQSEQPSLKVTWLIFDKAEKPLVINDIISTAYNGNLMDDNEVHYELLNSQLHIKRYIPDDTLSAMTGVTSPCITDCAVGQRDHEVALTSPGQPEILVSNPSPFLSDDVDDVLVEVHASVVDDDDVKAFHGSRSNLSGRFFSGRVLSDPDQWFAVGSQVVGWQSRGGKSSKISVPRTQLYECEADDPLPASAAHFAAACAGLSVVDGHARARVGDTFRINVSGILGEAIAVYATDCGAIVLDPEADEKADFNVALDTRGLIVNQSRVEIDKYLASNHGAYIIDRVWAEGPVFLSPLKFSELSQINKAFQEGRSDTAYSNVIIHTNTKNVKKSLAVYQKPRKLFSGGSYVIVGGLGGLGRCVCSWMVEKGAEKLYIISRNGIKSAEAQEAFDAINASGASMEVIKADACDDQAVSAAFAQIREHYPIKGVLNMAVLLGDAPLASMTGAEWNTALQLKIRSSWILHQETLNDDLEFFILFSSIASVLGNRNQAGYNVGNSFLNALAKYRRSKGLVGVSIGLGAMVDFGILRELGKGDILGTLTRSGLTHLEKHHLAKIMEAAIFESHDRNSERSFILTGLEMFDRVDGKLVGSHDQTMLYWTELPEFGYLQSYQKTWDSDHNTDGQNLSLKEQILSLDEVRACSRLLDAFLSFLAGLLGYESTIFEPKNPLAAYGLDSLSGVSCQYWFHRELGVSITVPEVVEAGSFNELVKKVHDRMQGQLDE